MSYESDECKLLIDEAIHDYLHDDTENEMAVKDWFYDLRKQAAKADEYEAKAKVLDRVKEFAEEPPFLLANNENEDYERYAYDQILKLINKYESGDHNV